MIAAAIHLSIVLLPGFFLVMLLGIYRQQLLFSIVFSSAVLIVLVSLARNFVWDVAGLLLAYSLLLTFLCSLLLLAGRSLITAQGVALAAAWKNSAWRNGLLLTTLGYLFWYAWTGPYTEVPADLYRHLEFTRLQLGYIQQGSFGPPLDLWRLVTQHGGFWYVLVALSSYLGRVPLDALLGPVMGVNGLLFLLSVYVFGYRLTSGLLDTSRQRAIAASLGALFVVGHMGTSAFSFVRYYSMAPVILNFAVFLAAQVCLLNLIAANVTGSSGRRLAGPGLGYGLLWFICFGVALIMHNQEGLFILLMALGTLAWMIYQRWVTSQELSARRQLLFVVPALILTGILVLVAMKTVFGEIPRTVSDLGRVVALPWQLPQLGQLYVLNPRFQFAETVSVWGGLVILLFVLNYQRFKSQPWLVAGMLMPAATVFNPVFVELYLRLEGDHSLWRLLFLMPLPLVAAIWVVWTWQDSPFSHRWRLAVLPLLFLLLLPVNPMASWNPHARTTNLPVPSENSERHWGDLIEALNRLPESEQILTDPVTGYVLSALTAHRTFRYKFFADDLYQAFPFAFDDYDHNPLSRYRGWLLVVNLRDGKASETGRRSGHWPEDILQISQYYPQSLVKQLVAHPGRFETVWSGQDITVYRILR